MAMVANEIDLVIIQYIDFFTLNSKKPYHYISIDISCPCVISTLFLFHYLTFPTAGAVSIDVLVSLEDKANWPK
jgi:hypothetical protein